MEAPTPSHLLNPRQLAKILNVSKGHIYRLVEQRRVPFIRVGGSVRFRPESIQAWLRKQETVTVNEAIRQAIGRNQLDEA